MLIYLQTIETPADESKFTAIYNAYCGLAYRIAFGHMKNEHDAQDVVQHVFMKIAENIKIIEPASPKTKQYLVTMVNNRVADVFRLRGRHPISPLNEDLDYSISLAWAQKIDQRAKKKLEELYKEGGGNL